MISRSLGEVSEGRANNFDLIRLILALLVMFSHSFPLLRGDNAQEPLALATRGQVDLGQLAVTGFFIISGFLITRSWLGGRGVRDYMKKRVLRIYPGFVVAVLLCEFVAGPLGSSRPQEYWEAMRARDLAIGIANLAPPFPPSFEGQKSTAINGSLWSIRFEFLCYLLVPALGAAGLLARRTWVAALSLACLAVYVAQVHAGLKIPGSRFTAIYGYPPFWPRVACAFLSGVVFYLYRDRIRLSTWGMMVASICLVAANRWGFLSAALPVAGSYLLFCAAYWPAPALQGLTGGNDLSYGIYLYAFPVQQLLVHAWGSALHPLGLFVAAAAITPVIAMFSWRLVERPFLRLRPSARQATITGPASAGRGRADGSHSLTQRINEGRS